MVSDPCVRMKPSSQRKETELPSWRLSPNLFPLTGTPGSGHSLCLKAGRCKKMNGEQHISPFAAVAHGNQRAKHYFGWKRSHLSQDKPFYLETKCNHTDFIVHCPGINPEKNSGSEVVTIYPRILQSISVQLSRHCINESMAEKQCCIQSLTKPWLEGPRVYVPITGYFCSKTNTDTIYPGINAMYAPTLTYLIRHH